MGVIIQPKDMLEGTIHETKSFGKLVITKYVNAKEVWFKFLDTGYESYTRTWLIRVGSVKDKTKRTVAGVGYLGVGSHKAYINSRVPSMAYSVWNGMLNRCYNEVNQLSHPTYIGCTVCDEWHNFQIFAEWYYGNHPDLTVSMDLDKDIKVDGNKVYSPDTCIFVTSQENTKKANEYKQRKFNLISPEGNIISGLVQAEFCREYGLLKPGLCNLINGKVESYRGWTLAK